MKKLMEIMAEELSSAFEKAGETLPLVLAAKELFNLS